jgi:hypothetical protein
MMVARRCLKFLSSRSMYHLLLGVPVVGVGSTLPRSAVALGLSTPKPPPHTL